MNTHADHAHAHDPSQLGFSRAFGIGIGLNTAFIIAEVIYGLKADSLALLADAGHNASDVLGLCMAWGAMILARRHPSERFTYGLQSASIMAAFANAIILMLALGGIGLEAVHRFANPESPAAGIVMWVAGAGIVVNGVTAWLFHGDSHDLNIRGAFLHMAADAAVSLGVVISAFVMARTGWLWLDPAVSLGIVFVIAIGTWKLFNDSLKLMLQAVPGHIDLPQVRDYLASHNKVKEVHDLHIWAISTTGIALSAHLVMPDGHPGDHFLHELREALAHRYKINHATIQIEMGDATDESHQECDDHAHSHHHHAHA